MAKEQNFASMSSLPTTSEFRRTTYIGEIKEKYNVPPAERSNQTIEGQIQEVFKLPSLKYVDYLFSVTFKDGTHIFDIEQPSSWIDYVDLYSRFANPDLNIQLKNFVEYLQQYINYDDFIFHQPEVLPDILKLESMYFLESGSASKLVGKKCRFCDKNTVFAQSEVYSRDEQPITKYKCTAPACRKDN